MSVRGAEGQLGRVRGWRRVARSARPSFPSALRGLLTVASGEERDRRDELPRDMLVIGLAIL